LTAIASSFHPWFYHEISLSTTAPSKEDHYRSLFLSGTSAAKKEEQFMDLLNVLPEPRTLQDILDTVKANLLAHPTAMLGEVGLDRSFRIGNPPYPSPPPKKLTPFSTPIAHQVIILEAQLDLAVELKRNVSIHSVGAQQVTVDLLKRMAEKHGAAWRAISIDMHSCGLSLEGWKDLEVTILYLSLLCH
jgi:Tat protein secretion system quality control protein TatD with DNase activity